ncbi:MAG TPA: hypothetical protein PLV68_01540, partial [Ilumatobacteraceae bacterium]|nr:hypothetical protein [Ilumatobacteraceae bacterium]
TDAGTLVAIDDDGAYVVVDQRSGKQVADFDADFVRFGTNAIVAYEFRTNGGFDVAVYDLKTGKELWSDDYAQAAIVVDGGVIVYQDDEIAYYK